METLSESLLDLYFQDDVAIEDHYQPSSPTPKALMVRWLASVAQLAPFMEGKIRPKLQATAQAAIDQCTSGTSGRECDVNWAAKSDPIAQVAGPVPAGR